MVSIFVDGDLHNPTFGTKIPIRQISFVNKIKSRKKNFQVIVFIGLHN
jgi:hypothetical protein